LSGGDRGGLRLLRCGGIAGLRKQCRREGQHCSQRYCWADGPVARIFPVHVAGILAMAIVGRLFG
jgi:hypothetical protein